VPPEACRPGLARSQALFGLLPAPRPALASCQRAGLRAGPPVKQAQPVPRQTGKAARGEADIGKGQRARHAPVDADRCGRRDGIILNGDLAAPSGALRQLCGHTIFTRQHNGESNPVKIIACDRLKPGVTLDTLRPICATKFPMSGDCGGRHRARKLCAPAYRASSSSSNARLQKKSNATSTISRSVGPG